MFERKDSFPWKIPVLILTGVLVLGSGILIGIKTRVVDTDNNITKVEQQKNNKAKDVFGLMESCEIWVEKKSQQGNNSTQSMMIGTVPKELLDKTEDEIIAYLTETYPDRGIDSIGKNRIVLSENKKTTEVETENIETDKTSRANKYTLENDNGVISLYKYDASGNSQLIEKTQIKIDSLPKTVQDQLAKGVVTETEDEAYSRLESFGS
ncbi:MAG: hypothetical protein RRZ84_06820 [Romboutsia sp.]